jgi:hypothetical protein
MKANIYGVSDLVLCVNGWFVAIELKIKGNTTTRYQDDFIFSVTQAGGIAGTAYTWGAVKRLISMAGYDVGEA